MPTDDPVLSGRLPEEAVFGSGGGRLLYTGKGAPDALCGIIRAFMISVFF